MVVSLAHTHTHWHTRSWGKVNGIVLLLLWRVASSPKPDREMVKRGGGEVVPTRHTHTNSVLYVEYYVYHIAKAAFIYI